VPGKSPFGHLKGPVLVSACLLGIPCRYNGRSKSQLELMENTKIIPVPICPEQLGGLPTPRPPAYFIGGDGKDALESKAILMNRENLDVTKQFIRGALNACRIAQLLKVKWAILKEKSPSCATHQVWLKDRLIQGIGVSAAMLKSAGVMLINEDGMV
jgi:uncharacterized protein YbbK (DUF523 family)